MKGMRQILCIFALALCAAGWAGLVQAEGLVSSTRVRHRK